MPSSVDNHAEAKAMLLARHDHVVEVYTADVINGQPVIRMEYLPNGSVESRYGGKALPVRTAIQVIEDACRGVQQLHTQGLLHRDIKPANLLFDAFGRIKVSDFGLAGMANDPETLPSMGYLKLLPPEAWTSGSFIDNAAGDIYALGGTAYRLLNGDEMLHSAVPEAGELAHAVKVGAFPDRQKWKPYVHLQLKKAVIKALHPDPTKRHASATAMRHALEKARPVVSWNDHHDGRPFHWIGESSDHSSWEAGVGMTRGIFRFTVKRGKNGGALRELRRDRADLLKSEEILPHARKVLQRIARTGA